MSISFMPPLAARDASGKKTDKSAAKSSYWAGGSAGKATPGSLSLLTPKPLPTAAMPNVSNPVVASFRFQFGQMNHGHGYGFYSGNGFGFDAYRYRNGCALVLPPFYGIFPPLVVYQGNGSSMFSGTAISGVALNGYPSRVYYGTRVPFVTGVVPVIGPVYGYGGGYGRSYGGSGAYRGPAPSPAAFSSPMKTFHTDPRWRHKVYKKYR
ncbi:MAG TPA: hypothetical protein DEB39_13050 [Planctomycetaceae bacterium]|nr:hypothetical protein [Planctomycetaceae bacterium]